MLFLARRSLLPLALIATSSACIVVNEGTGDATSSLYGESFTDATYEANVGVEPLDVDLHQGKGTTTRIVLSSDPRMCRDITYEVGPIDGPFLVMELTRRDDKGALTSAHEPGNYPVGITTPPPTGLSVVATLTNSQPLHKGGCPTLDGEVLQDGSVTIDSSGNGKLEGSFDLINVLGRHLTGTFTAGECSILQCQ